MDGYWDIGPTSMWKSDPLPPALQSVKDRFPPRSEWLWKKCNETLDPKDPYSMDMELLQRARVLGLALNNPGEGTLTPYPLRPPGSMPSSESVDKFRAILFRAPRIPEDGNGEDDIDGMVRHETFHPEWDVWYDWDGPYYDEMFLALIEVIKEHGVGDEGWASARWEVYDKASVPLTLARRLLISNGIHMCSMRIACQGLSTIIGNVSDGTIVPNLGLMHRGPWVVS
jgi:hypothetical protein